MSSSILKDSQKILFIGDSITEAGRLPTNYLDLGSGFVRLFSDMLIAKEPNKNIKIINRGIGGNSIKHLLTRCQDDVVEQEPDVLFVLIGINDVIRHMDSSASLHAAPDEFKSIYEHFLQEVMTCLPLVKVFLVEPFYLSKSQYQEGSYRAELMKTLEFYTGEIKVLAEQFGMELIRLSESFNRVFLYKSSLLLSEDRIHPNATGHMIIAETIYQYLLEGSRV